MRTPPAYYDPLDGALDMLRELHQFMESVELSQTPFSRETVYIIKDMLPPSYVIALAIDGMAQ